VAEVTTLREELRAMRVASIREYAHSTIAASRLPQRSRDGLITRVDALLERREADRAEIDAMLAESVSLWADWEQQYGSGRVNNPSDPNARITLAEGETDRLVAAIDGMFYNQDRTLGSGDSATRVRRFTSLREAYSRWTGRHPFDVTPIGLMQEMHVNYDSAIQGIRLFESMTTASWAEVFSDRLYRRMVAEYMLPDLMEWRDLVTTENVPDFRTQRRERVGGYGNLPTVAEAGTYQTLTSPGDEEASYAVVKRGGLDDITFEMIQNDDLRNIRNIPVKLGRAAKQTLYQFVMDFLRDGFSDTIYDGNALFDHTTHANVAGGAAAAELGEAGLTDGWQRMRGQLAFGSTTEFLGTRPRFLWVPAELEQLAWRLVNSSVTILDANFNATEPNFWQQRLTPRVVDYWTDANNWFLSADPNQVPTIEIGFLNGQEDPELFVQDQPNVGSVMTADKITYKIRHIYSGAVLDWRGLVGSNPA
jgi:hypothetical protein